MGFIQGIPRDQLILYPERLEELVPETDPVRLIDEFCRSVPYQQLGFSHAVPAATGRPCFTACSLLSLLIWGFMNGRTSSRQLERSTHRNVDVMWLLERVQPDFKTISEFRRRNVVQIVLMMKHFRVWLMEQDLVAGDLVAIDGSKFRASNAKDRNFTEKTLAAKRARIEAKIQEYLDRLEQADALDEQEGDPLTLTADQIRDAIAKLKERKDFFAGLAETMKQTGAKQISLTDPDSRSMKTNDGMNVCFNGQIVVDSKHNLIIAQAVTNQVNDEQQLFAMASAAKEGLGVEQLTVVADAGYVNSTEIAQCEEHNIIPYLPALTDTSKAEVFPKSDFRYDPATDSYTCPAGKTLEHVSQALDRNRLVHYYRTPECAECPLRSQCTSSKDGRRIARRDDEEFRTRASERGRSNPTLMKKRKAMVEHPFGTIKRGINLGYFRLRGLMKVSAELALAVLAYDLKRVLTIRAALTPT